MYTLCRCVYCIHVFVFCFHDCVFTVWYVYIVCSSTIIYIVNIDRPWLVPVCMCNWLSSRRREVSPSKWFKWSRNGQSDLFATTCTLFTRAVSLYQHVHFLQGQSL